MANKETAVIVGVGPGLGAALARRFSTADFIVAIAARGSIEAPRHRDRYWAGRSRLSLRRDGRGSG